MFLFVFWHFLTCKVLHFQGTATKSLQMVSKWSCTFKGLVFFCVLFDRNTVDSPGNAWDSRSLLDVRTHRIWRYTLEVGEHLEDIPCMSFLPKFPLNTIFFLFAKLSFRLLTATISPWTKMQDFTFGNSIFSDHPDDLPMQNLDPWTWKIGGVF